MHAVTRRRKPRSAPPAAHPPANGVRPRFTLIAPGASPEEAAAIVAALERFILDTTPPPAPPPPASIATRWLRAALRDGISRGERRRGAWGDPHP
ncbi:MAG: hypothetical protein QOF77_2243 [Solirubrobacteraceae bacterium]|jgi:hypothetical protein|nr:hypothetical protein [Solirubrobacteraceae bacterium]